MLSRRLVLVVLILPCACVVLPGCGGNPQQEARESSNLKPLAVLYGRYLSSHKGKPPTDEAAFKAFVKGLDAKQLEGSGAKDVDSIFVSSRDKQPYVVLYGNDVANASMSAVVIAYEQQGVGGRRYIATSLAQVEEVDEAELRKRVPSAK